MKRFGQEFHNQVYISISSWQLPFQFLIHNTRILLFARNSFFRTSSHFFSSINPHLQEFPYDTQALSIKVKIDKRVEDHFSRSMVPLCTDKGFFCTSRVAPLFEWSIAKNMDWEVESGAGGDPTRDGGKQRLVASIIVCRKSFYCE